MRDQKIDVLFCSLSQNARRNINRRADARDPAGIFDLETVKRIVPIAHVANPQKAVGVTNNLVKRSHAYLSSLKLQIPIPNSQFPNKSQIGNPKKSNFSIFEIIEEKISVSSRACSASLSRAATVVLVKPMSINRKNNRLSLASLRQIFTRIRKSFLLNASSASIQLAATDPDARTNCRTSSVLLIVRGSCLTTARTNSANRNVQSSRSRGLEPSSI